MSQLLARKRKYRRETVTLAYHRQQILFCRAVLNFDIIYYNCVFEWWLCPLGFYVPKSYSVCAVKTSVPFVFNQQWRIHLGSPQHPVTHLVFHSKMGRWICFVPTIALDDSDLNWINLQWWLRVIMIQSSSLKLQPSSTTITENFPNNNIPPLWKPTNPLSRFSSI